MRRSRDPMRRSHDPMRRAATILALLLAAACSSSPAIKRVSGASPTPEGAAAQTAAPGESAQPSGLPSAPPPGTTAAPGPTPAPGAKTTATEPRVGKYVYDMSGKETTGPGKEEAIPAGTTLTVDYGERREVSGAVELTSHVTEERPGSSPNPATVNKERWEPAKVLALATTFDPGGGGPIECKYDPPLMLLRLPPRPESFPKQTWSGTDCSGSLELNVVSAAKADAMGRKWDAWRIERRTIFTLKAVITVDLTETAWFVPELAAEVRIEQKETDSAGAQTFPSTRVLVMRSHP